MKYRDQKTGDDEQPIPARTKNFLIDPSLKQINDLTDIKVSYTQEKKGRKIIGFTFKFKFKETAKKKEEKRMGEQTDQRVREQTDQQQERKKLRKIPSLSDEQINMFCFKIMKNYDFIRDYSNQTVGKSTDEVYNFIEAILRDDDKRQDLTRYLLLVGYEYPERLKKS